MNARLSTLFTILALAMLSVQAQAAVLTFDGNPPGSAGYWQDKSSIPAPHNSDPTLPLYGDHVSSFTEGTVTSPNAYSYGTTYGLTPNVGIAYGPGDPTQDTSAANPVPVWFSTRSGGGFGDLTNVMFQIDYANSTANLTMSITLTADPGFVATLEGFDLAGWNGLPNNLDLLKVIVDGTPHVIGTNIAVPNANNHSTYDFSAAPYTGSTVEIFLDGRSTAPYDPLNGDVSQQAVNNFTDIAIDNIAFGESELPEPASLGLLACGSLLLLRRRLA